MSRASTPPRSRPARAAMLVLGAWLVASAGRFRGDLGDLLPAPVALVLLVLGLVLLAAVAAPRWGRHPGSASGAARPFSRVSWSAWVPVAAALAFVAQPESMLAALLLAAMLVLAHRPPIARWMEGIPLTVVAVLCAVGVNAVVDRLALAGFGLPLLAQAVGTGLGWLGAEAAAGQGTAIQWTVRAANPVPASTNALGLAVQATIAVIVVTVGIARGRARSRLPLLVAAGLCAALLVRLSGVVTIGAAGDALLPFEQPSYATGPYLDWRWGLVIDLLAAACFWPAARSALATGEVRAAAEPAVAPLVPAVGCLAGVLLAFGAFADALSSDRPIRLAMDEGHSRWEPTDLRLGEHVYGQETGYNFRALADWLGARLGPVRRLYDPLDGGVLQDVDVLVLKTPTSPFTEGEVEAVVSFVEEGGGLVLIGDHTNVFGTSDVLAPIARRFGFEFQLDCLFDERQRFEHVLRPDPAQRRHPILARVPLVRFEVGCSILVHEPFRVEPVAIGRGMKSQMIDYSASNFYPAVRDSSDMAYGQFADIVAARHGSGRVIGLADSTFLSTFSICLPGRRELFDGIVDWVGRRDRIPARLRFPAGWAVLVACALWLLGAWRGLRDLALGGLAAAAVIGFGELLAKACQESSTGAPSAAEVYFLEPATERVSWPVTRMVREEPRSYNLFFQWMLRTGSFPRLIPSMDSGVQRHAPVVWIDPPALAPGELDRLEEHARGGGALVLLEVAPNPTVERIADLAGLSLSGPGEAAPFVAVATAHGPVELGGVADRWRTIEGGEPLLRGITTQGEVAGVVASVARVGDGAIVVLSCGELFSDLAYGIRYEIVPDQNRRRLYQVQFDLLHAIVGRTAGAIVDLFDAGDLHVSR